MTEMRLVVVGAAVVDLSDRKLLRLTGKDPTAMLNAVLTNDVPTGEVVSLLFDNLTQSWAILSTMTPSEYMRFRDKLARSSGAEASEVILERISRQRWDWARISRTSSACGSSSAISPASSLAASRRWRPPSTSVLGGSPRETTWATWRR